MTDAEKAKYNTIIYRLSIITSRINDLNKSLYSFEENCKSNLSIDGAGYQVNNTNKVINSLSNVQSVLIYDVINSIKRRMYN